MFVCLILPRIFGGVNFIIMYKRNYPLCQLFESAAIAAGGKLLGSLFSSNDAAINRKFEAEENEKNRKFNAEQARLSREYNTEMWNKTNEYNSPIQERARLEAAGLNPDMIYSDASAGATATMGSTSQQASSNNGVLPVMPDRSYIADIGKTIAETQLIEAQRDKLESETVGQDIANKYASEYQEGLIKLNNANASLLTANTNLSEAQARQIDSVINNINKQTELFGAQIGNIIEQTQNLRVLRAGYVLDNSIKSLQLAFDSQSFQSRIDRICADAAVSRANALYAKSMAHALLLSTLASAYQSNQQGGYYNRQSQVLDQSIEDGIGHIQARLLSSQSRYYRYGSDYMRSGSYLNEVKAGLVRAQQGQVIINTRLLEKELQWKDFNNVIDAAGNIVGMVNPFYNPVRRTFSYRITDTAF